MVRRVPHRRDIRDHQTLIIHNHASVPMTFNLSTENSQDPNIVAPHTVAFCASVRRTT